MYVWCAGNRMWTTAWLVYTNQQFDRQTEKSKRTNINIWFFFQLTCFAKGNRKKSEVTQLQGKTPPHDQKTTCTTNYLGKNSFPNNQIWLWAYVLWYRKDRLKPITSIKPEDKVKTKFFFFLRFQICLSIFISKQLFSLSYGQ